MTLIKRNINNFVPSLWNDLLEKEWPLMPGLATVNGTNTSINVKESNDKFSLEILAPGFNKEDFKIDLDNNLLSISVEKTNEVLDSSSDEKYTRKEFTFHSFSRVFTMPESVEADKMKASYESGILTIEIPKREEAKSKPVKSIKIA